MWEILVGLPLEGFGRYCWDLLVPSHCVVVINPIPAPGTETERVPKCPGQMRTLVEGAGGFGFPWLHLAFWIAVSDLTVALIICYLL